MTDGPQDLDTAYREQSESKPILWEMLRRYGWSYRLLLLAGLLTAGLSPLLNLVPPYLLGVAIDAVANGPGAFGLPFVPQAWIPGDLEGQLLLTGGIVAATAAVSVLNEAADSVAWSLLQHHVEHDLRIDTYDAAQRLGMTFFTSAQTGDVMSVLNDDMGTVQGVLSGWFKQVYQLLLFGIGILLVMISMNWQLALVVVAAGTPLSIAYYLFRQKIAPLYTDARQATGQYNARLENGIGGVGTVKANTNESYERERVADRSRTLRDIQIDGHRYNAFFWGFNRLMLQGSTLLVLFVGGWLVLNGPSGSFFAPVTVGTFVTFFFYARRFTDRMTDLGGVIDTYERIAAAGRRVFGLMEYPATIPETEDPRAIDGFDGDVSYQNLSFRYPDTEELALEDISFDVEANSFVGIVGQTGAGKTTLCKLLVRFYDSAQGSISIDGHDIRDLALSDLRDSIGYVEQEPFLFDDTVGENIAYAAREADDEAIHTAAKRARAHEFISDLEDGYDTQVGERGVKLSGGQRQRIVIARELLRDPDILILDEATSHVDNETELLIQQALGELTRDRTTFAIAHRLSTVRTADTILVLDDGSIAERGSHEQLLEHDGLYATLWNIHLGNSETKVETVG